MMQALNLASKVAALLSPRRAERPAAPRVEVPAPFSEAQARLLVALKELGIGRDDATWLMWASERFSQAQVRCGLELLDLEPADMHATLADAMWPCPLRGQLMRGAVREDKGLGRLRVELPLEVEKVHRQAGRWELAGKH